MLWFAFILLSLSYWKQQDFIYCQKENRCDLLSFYYLCRTGNNRFSSNLLDNRVVICFHFTIFVVLETTRSWYATGHRRLWFAFILLSLSYWKQRWRLWRPVRSRCDLLSFYYLCRTGNNNKVLCRTGNNNKVSAKKAIAVVICFHFTIFVVLETTMQYQ